MLAGAALLAVAPLWAQYPGQVTKTGKDNPVLRSVAVLEWTGEAGKPKACRIVPVAVLDEGQLQDGGIYKSRPEPLALAGEVEYQLEQDGKAVGLFDIRNSGREQGSWVGYGAWKPMPAPAPKPSLDELAKTTVNDEDNDRPVLHRKKHADDGAGGGAGKGDGSGKGTGSSAPTPADDPDRPKLTKKDTSDPASNGDTPQTSTPGADGPALSNGVPASGTAPAGDTDRPTIRKKKKQPEDVGHVVALASATDPDRPRLTRGKSTLNGLDVLPSLMGLPPDMQQAVAVSDTKSRPEHPWNFTWANPGDEAKLKSSLEDIARDALGLKTPAPAPAPAARRTAARKPAKAAPAPPPPPPPLTDEQFRVFELAYGSGATLVLTAHTGGPREQQKFVTLIAQPDLYGNIMVLMKSVTDGAHLDETPRMRLVDAVDAMADNRGVLLFELRGDTLRQFALYRVLRGQAQKLFVTGGGEYGKATAN